MQTLVNGMEKVMLFLTKADITSKQLNITHEHMHTLHLSEEVKLKQLEVERLTLELELVNTMS